MRSNCILRTMIHTFLGFVLFFIVPAAFSQSPSIQASVASPRVETWFGWIETPKQQLRTIVRIERDEHDKVVAGSMTSPDQSLDELPLNGLNISPSGTWQFELSNPTSKLAAKYTGMQTATDLVSGEFEQGGETLSLKFRKIESMPPETRNDLGADSVWLGTLDLVVRKLDYRIRVYSKPPYASAAVPRFLFDSLTQNIPGIPAQYIRGSDGQTILEMKTIPAKFIGALNETGDELDGRYIQGSTPLKLVLKLQSKAPVTPSSIVPNKEMRPSKTADAAVEEQPAKEATKELAKEPAREPTKESAKEPAVESPASIDGASVPAIAKTNVLSTEFFDEVPFEVVYGVEPKKGKEPNKATGIKLAGTITIPKLKAGQRPRKFPAVVMVTGSGPQDRNETVGRHKPFQTIAHYLAENGIASLRYDDRSVGGSTGDVLNATSEDFAKDAIAVWKHAKSLVELDSQKIGILGHSEGGLVGPMAAVWEPEIAFLILIAPPGVNGSEVLKSQIDRISELQGMRSEDRKATMALQSRLQDIASSYFSDEGTLKREIQAAIRQNWEGLKSIARGQDPNVNLDEMKKVLTDQIEEQFQQLRSPWYRFFLSYDPSTNWMMMRCPTLAMWGSNDVQILPELNRNNLRVAVERNADLNVQFSIVPGLNHLMQTSQSGLPEEYDIIEETVSPTALKLIRDWALAQGIIDI